MIALIMWEDWMFRVLFWGGVFALARLISNLYYGKGSEKEGVPGSGIQAEFPSKWMPPAPESLSAGQVAAIVEMAKQRFGMKSYQIKRSITKGLGASPGAVNDFLEDLEIDMKLRAKDKVDVKKCSVEDIIMNLVPVGPGK